MILMITNYLGHENNDHDDSAISNDYMEMEIVSDHHDNVLLYHVL